MPLIRTTPPTFRVSTPFVQLEQDILLKNSIHIPVQNTTQSNELIPASATIGGACVILKGNHSNYQWDTASNILEQIRLQVSSTIARPSAIIPNGTYVVVTVLNKAVDESTSLTIDENHASDDNWVFYNNTSESYIYWGCASQYILTVIEQKALGDANDWINVTMLDY